MSLEYAGMRVKLEDGGISLCDLANNGPDKIPGILRVRVQDQVREVSWREVEGITPLYKSN